MLALAFLSGALFASAATAAPERPQISFRESLNRLDASLRFAIEEGPAELIKAMGSSTRICGEAKAAEIGGDSNSAKLWWKTLSVLVAHADRPAGKTIIDAFGASHAGLGDLHARFSKRWPSQTAKAGELTIGVAETRQGIRLMHVLVLRLEDAFGSWNRHDCTGAQRTIDTTNRRIPPAIEKINVGMGKLQSLR